MAYRTPYWETRRIDEEKRAARLAETRMRDAGTTERARVAATPTGRKPADARSVAAPIAEAPYLPKRLEEGRLGDIMRASPKELKGFYERTPEMERPIQVILGEESSWVNPLTHKSYGSLRTAMTGFRQRPAETTAAGRLSAAIQKRDREQMFEDYDIKTTAMFSPYTTRGPKGEELIPAWARELYSTGKAMSLEDPEGAIRHVEGVLSERKRIQTEAKDMEDTDLMAAAGLGTATGAPVVTIETPETPETPEAPRARTGLSAPAAKLRAEYEKEYAAPIIGAKTLGRISEAWKKREASPYVEPPSGLRGYR